MKRLCFAVFMVFCLCLIVSPAAATLFDDVPEGHWALDAIRDLQKQGIIKGFSEDNTFRGEKPINRYEMVVLVKRLIGNLETGDGIRLKQVELVRDLLMEFADDMKFLGESALYHMDRLRTVEDRLDRVESRLDEHDKLIRDLKRKQKRLLILSILLTGTAAAVVK